MQLGFNDWIGFIGVALLLVAFLFNLAGKIEKEGLVYIGLNVVGAALACLASWLISYIPFVLLEGCWTLVSLWALISYIRRKSGQ